jgi:hypothetical protein
MEELTKQENLEETLNLIILLQAMTKALPNQENSLRKNLNLTIFKLRQIQSTITQIFNLIHDKQISSQGNLFLKI